ncbi:MAG: hypothetical protein IKF37_01010 [Bacilli bacterium]|nr:hypothetical protein [Bacilli bacterium]
MKKVFKKIVNFIKLHKLLFLILAGIIVLGIIIYLIFFRLNISTIKRVRKIASPSFYDISCLNADCDYIVASKGDKYGKYTTFVYNASGKKIARINETYDSKSSYTKTISDATKNYVIFMKKNYTTGDILGYTLSNTKGKDKYNSKTLLYSLTDNLIAEKFEDSYKILDRNGKIIFSDVKDINVYANNTIVSINTNREDMILDSKGNTLLNGYKIVSDITNKKGESLYFIVVDSNRNAYYYYDYKKNNLNEESFNGYTKGKNEGELIITKTGNGSYTKYVLDKSGKISEYVSENNLELVGLIRNQIDTKEYGVYSDSIRYESQKYILVNKLKDNSLGVYNISSKKYTKILDYAKENGSVALTVLDSDNNNLYLQINCSNVYCKKDTMIVYDVINARELYKSENKNAMASYIEYDGNYKVIKYSNNASEEYKDKYVLYDKNNKEILKTNNQIVVVDKKKIFGKDSSYQSLILFNSKSNKALNSDDNLASKISISSTIVYKYSDKDNTYLLNEKGKVLNRSSKSASLIYGSDTIMCFDESKISIINPIDNRNKSYKMKKNEKINDNSGQNITPYKNSLFINNTVDKYIKVINANGRTVKKISKSTLNSAHYNEKTGNVIIITKQLKNNNNLYGLYIAK